MLKKIKKLINKNKNSIEIKPIFENNSVKISVFENGKELDWDSLSLKEQEKYIKLLDEKYSNKQVPLSSFTPRAKPMKTIEEYSCPFNDIDFLIDALKDWEECPDSHPAIEKWYQDGCPKIERPKTQEKIDFDEYSTMFNEAKKLEAHDPLVALEKYTYILDNYKPAGTSYYTEPTDLFCRLCRYNEAIFCLGRAKENIEVFNKSTQNAIINEFPNLISNIKHEHEIFDKVLKIVRDNPGIVQSEIYKKANINENKARFVIQNMAYSGFLKREKYKNSYKLFYTDKVIDKNYLIGF